MRKVTYEQEKEICSRYNESSIVLSKEYNVKPSTIRSIWRRNSLIGKKNPIKDNDIFVQKYQSGMTIQELEDYFHVGRHTITRKAHQLGIYKNHSRVLTLNQEQYVVNCYNKKSAQSLANELKTTKECIGAIWHRYNLTGKTNRQYYLNEDYFSVIDSPDKAYWLGWIASDGCIYESSDSRQMLLCFGLQASDAEILQKLNRSLNCTKPLSFSKVKTPTGKIVERVNWQISSNKLCKDLEQYNLHPRKTYDYIFPDNINKEYYRDFIRGFFDGDGTISHNFSQNTLYSVNVSITGFFKNLKKIQEILSLEDIDSHLQKDYRKYNTDGDFGSLVFTNKIMKTKFLHYIYDDANLYLERKYKLAKKFISLVATGKKCWICKKTKTEK